MNNAQNKGLLCAKRITITLLVMGAPDYSQIFYFKAAARALFAKHHESVCWYPLVTVDGRELPTITAARRYFGMKYASNATRCDT